MGNDELLSIVKEFLDNATPEERKELDSLLRKRGSLFGGQVDIYNFAANMAEKIRHDIGYSQRNIKNTARRLVVDLALQYDPDISIEELKAVLREMVPEEQPVYRKLPREVLLVMIEHFISFSDGAMPKETAAGLTKGWQKKYWNVFPPKLKRIIASYISRNISPDEFWRIIRTAFKKTE